MSIKRHQIFSSFVVQNTCLCHWFWFSLISSFQYFDQFLIEYTNSLLSSFDYFYQRRLCVISSTSLSSWTQRSLFYSYENGGVPIRFDSLFISCVLESWNTCFLLVTLGSFLWRESFLIFPILNIIAPRQAMAPSGGCFKFMPFAYCSPSGVVLETTHFFTLREIVSETRHGIPGLIAGLRLKIFNFSRISCRSWWCHVSTSSTSSICSVCLLFYWIVNGFGFLSQASYWVLWDIWCDMCRQLRHLTSIR